MRAWGAALVLALLACGPPAAVAAAQDGDRAPATDAADVADAPPPGTGDAWIDVRLDDMDRYAARYREAFVDEIARYLEAPRPVLVEALERGMRPGDLYYACALARERGQRLARRGRAARTRTRRRAACAHPRGRARQLPPLGAAARPPPDPVRLGGRPAAPVARRVDRAWHSSRVSRRVDARRPKVAPVEGAGDRE